MKLFNSMRGMRHKNGQTTDASGANATLQSATPLGAQQDYPGYGQEYGAANEAGSHLTVADYANGVPNIKLSEIPASFMRQLPWMIPALALMVGTSWLATRKIKRKYEAQGRILVQVGAEYVYDPTFGNSNSGINITADQITQTEADIIKNAQTIEQVIAQLLSSPTVGPQKFAPKLYEKWKNAPAAQKGDRWNDIIKMVDKSYVVMPKPKSSIVNLVYKHTDPAVAVEALDTFMTSYLDFRNNIFVSEASGLVAQQRELTAGQLNELDRKIQNILNRNGISDFDSEQSGVQKRSEALRGQINILRGKISAVEAALSASENQLRNTAPTIDLQIDDRASQRLAQAQLERRQLLAKYLPTSNPVKAKEAEIKEIREQINANGGKPVGGRRVGPNSVYQTLVTQRNTYQAQANSYREQEITLTQQLNTAVSKVKSMRVLSPQYDNLLREKLTLEERLKGLNAKEQAALATKQQQDSKSDNIKVITRPITARKGRNMKRIAFALASIGSLFTVLMLGLLRVFLDPRLYGNAGKSKRGSQANYVANQAYAPNQEAAMQYGVVPAGLQASVPAAAQQTGQYPNDQYSDPQYGAPQYAEPQYGYEQNAVADPNPQYNGIPEPVPAQAYAPEQGQAQGQAQGQLQGQQLQGQLQGQQAVTPPLEDNYNNPANPENPYLQQGAPVGVGQQNEMMSHAGAGGELPVLGQLTNGQEQAQGQGQIQAQVQVQAQGQFAPTQPIPFPPGYHVG